MLKLLSVVAEDSAAVVNQSRETFSKSSSYMTESPQSSSPDGVQEQSSAVGAEGEIKNKYFENREVIINYGDDGGFTAIETLESIEIEATSKKVSDAITVSSETQGNIQVIVDTGEKIDIMLMDEDISSVTSSLIVHDVQINMNSADEIDACLTSIAVDIDDKWKMSNDEDKETKHNNGDNTLQSTHVQLNSEIFLSSNANGEAVRETAGEISNHGVGSGMMVSEMQRTIQVEMTSEEEIDAFIVSKETIEDVKAVVESDEENETILTHANACSVMSSWTLHNVQIDLTSVEEINVCLLSISTHDDDKWKKHCDAVTQVTTNHGEKNRDEIMSDAKLRKQPSVFSGVKESCDDPCAIHPGVYRFEIKVHIKEEGKERLFRNSRLSPSLRRSTRRALAFIEDTSPLSNPFSTPAVKNLNSDHNQLDEKGDGVENPANVKEDMTKSATDRTEDYTNMEKEINQVEMGHVKNSANAREDVKESKSGRVPSSILRKSTLKKKKESKEHRYDEKSVYSTFSTDTYNSFQSLVRDVEKEALLCFVKVGRYLGL